MEPQETLTYRILFQYNREDSMSDITVADLEQSLDNNRKFL